MYIPTAVFLDTSILDGQNYNFNSATFVSFANLAKTKNLQLILPDPTKREVQRHIRQRSLDAIRALEQAKRAAPFLAKWTHFPKFKEGRVGEWEVQRIASKEWEEFQKQFTVVHLDYKAVDLPMVMDWYDSAAAPFNQGKKRKEFPDALAIAALAAHAAQTKQYIAVVSADGDFKAACDRFTYLMYFPSLPILLELLLSDDKKIDELRHLVDKFDDTLTDAVHEAVADLPIYHNDSHYDEGLEIEHIDHVRLSDIRIVALGDHDCTVAFNADIEYTARLTWTEPERYFRHGPDREYQPEPGERRRERVSDTTAISGTAKLRFVADRSAVEKITSLHLDEDEIIMTEEP